MVLLLVTVQVEVFRQFLGYFSLQDFLMFTLRLRNLFILASISVLETRQATHSSLSTERSLITECAYNGLP